MAEKNRQSGIPGLTASLDKLAVALEKKNSLDEKKLLLEHKKFLFEQHKYRSTEGKSIPVHEETPDLLDNLKVEDLKSGDFRDIHIKKK